MSLAIQANPGLNLIQTTFPTDDIGNLIIPGSTFNGTKDVRVKILAENKIVLEAIDYIMTVTGKKRNDAGEVWRNFSEERKQHFQNDLNDDESKYLYFFHFFGDQVNFLYTTKMCLEYN